MEKYREFFVIGGMILSYFFLGAMSTTNIMRLLKGVTVKQSYPHCRCDNCGRIIPVYHQVTVLSYLFSKGRCRECGVKIPVITVILEAVVFGGMTAITAVFDFSPWSVVFSFCYFELVKWIMIFRYGKREDFVKEYIVSVGYLLVAFILIEIMSLMYTFWCK